MLVYHYKKGTKGGTINPKMKLINISLFLDTFDREQQQQQQTTTTKLQQVQAVLTP